MTNETTTTHPDTSLPEYLTIRQIAGILHRSEWAVHNACTSGELRASQPGGQGAWLIAPADLRAYVDSHPVETSSAGISVDGLRVAIESAGFIVEGLRGDMTEGDASTVITDLLNQIAALKQVQPAV